MLAVGSNVFCEYFEIPYRTMQDWELGNRKMPDYLLRLMAYKIKMENFLNSYFIDVFQKENNYYMV